MSVDSKRKHISDRTKWAATLLALGDVPYDDAKEMHEDQIISLYQYDHNVLHTNKETARSVGLLHVDHFSNLTPRLIREHREKTKNDLGLIAKSKRLRKRMEAALRDLETTGIAVERISWDEMKKVAVKRKLRSRGFDRTLTRKFSGQVVKRQRKGVSDGKKT